MLLSWTWLGRPGHFAAFGQAGIVEDDLRMRRLPAIEQALQIIEDANAQMRIDTALRGAAAKPHELRLIDMHCPIEAVLWRPKPVVRPLRQLAIGHRNAARIED